MIEKELTWVEISKANLQHNMREFRKIVGSDVLLCPCIKSNAYGHGLVECGKAFLEAGADWLSVNSLYEARALRKAKVTAPIYVLGYIPLSGLKEAVALNLRMVVYNRETIDRLAEILSEGQIVKLHIKVETGNNRQGVLIEDLLNFAKYIQSFPGMEIEGIATHFANIEDTTDHSYAEQQINKFKEAASLLEAAGIELAIKHCANSAATILFQKTHFNLVRVGVSSYGMWPSNETYVSYLKEVGEDFSLKPAITWKAKIAQIKEIPAGEFIGYGCTFRTSHTTRLAIIPIGYYDGYDRCMNGAHVLINGKRAPVRGRVCMNIIMVDITDIPEAQLEGEAILIGKSGEEEISAEQFAAWAGTINYEVVTRINERIPRLIK